MTSCAFCGRENDESSRFCIDCGKPLHPSAARVGPAINPNPSGGKAQPQPSGRPVVAPVAASSAAASQQKPAPAAAVAHAAVPPTRVSDALATCPRCAKSVDPSLPFCAHCGSRVMPATGAGACGQCGATFVLGMDIFCARCGSRVGERVSEEDATRGEAEGATGAAGGTLALSASRRGGGPRLALLGESGDVVKSFVLDTGEAVIGRGDADIRFADDHYMSPLHARLEQRAGKLFLRDLGSRNASWVFIDHPTKLVDGDLVLVGSQLLRFRRLGYPGPHPPEADSTRRMGSLVPAADVAVLEQLRADGSVRDTFHLSPGRSMLLGRESGDWLFPYDQTMSARHAEVRSEDVEFFVHDAGSRNGVAMAVRGERELKAQSRILVGDQLLRVESL